MGVPRKYSPEKQAEIVGYREDHPGMTLEDIGRRFGTTGSYVSTLCQRAALREQHERIHAKPEIRPHMMPGLSLSLLTGGSARRVKLSPA